MEKDVPLWPFKGDRSNFLFHNAAGLYFLYPELLDFFAQVEKDNQLMGVVYSDLKVSTFKSGCPALGMINKIITSPLWRVLNAKDERGCM